MQISSVLHTALHTIPWAIALASVLGATTLAYADAPAAQRQTSAVQANTVQQGAASQNSPYDGPDFVVPESQIFS